LEEKQKFSTALQGYTPRNYSENGGRLFFDSEDALVPHDGNGRQDVYEWEQDGEGSCVQANGCIYPISDVAGNYESFFLDASPNGNDVFFATEDQLVPADSDFHVDIYDGRVNGGFPVSPEPQSCDNGDSCKGPVSPQPGAFGTPASEVVRVDRQAVVVVEPVCVKALRADSRVQMQLAASEPSALPAQPLQQHPLQNPLKVWSMCALMRPAGLPSR
jgi:hypothetical protein